MAKLTEDQKAQNKAAMLARNRAYSARLKAEREAKALAEAFISKTDQAKQRDAAMFELEAAIEERRRIEAEFDDQIRALQKQKQDAVATQNARFDALKMARDSACKALNALQEQEKAKIALAFPDLEGVYSAGGWKSLEEFMPAKAKGI